MPSYSRLTESKRYTIEALHRKRTPQTKIAEILDVHPSTISWELRRLRTDRPYSHRKAQRDHQKLKKRDQTSDPQLRSLAAQKLRKEQWSPEQISG
ncbi:MAG: helix-turn-helix domain-containing protein [Akkermansiaceae bacterium]